MITKEKFDEVRHYVIAWDFENTTLLGDEPNKEHPSMKDLEDYATKLSDTVELVWVLREVARAAQVVNGELLHDIYEDPELHALDTALAKLPAWLLKEE